MPDERIEIVIQGQDRLSPAAKSANASLAGLNRQAEASRLSLSRMSQGLTAAGQSMMASGMMMTTAVTLPIVGIGVAALKTAADYEKSMNILQAVTSATATQMAEMDKLAIALGADMSLPATSASDAAKAMTELAKAGLSVNNVMGAAKGVLQLAAAGNITEAEAAEIAANALNAFKLKGEEASRVADLLAASANASSAEVVDMAMAMRMSAAVFASAKIPIEDLIAGLGLMANAGIKNSDAGTSMKQMLLQLETPTKKARELMSGLGISVYDASGNMKSMRDLIGTFSTKLKGATQEQRDFVLGTIFGSDAIRSANIVFMEGVDAFDAMKKAVTEEGAAAKLAEARTKGLSGAIDGLKSQAETFLLTAGKPMLKNLADLVRGAANLVGKLTTLDPKIIEAAAAFGMVLASVGPLKLAIGALTLSLGFLLSPVGIITTAVGLLATAWTSDFLGMQGHVQSLMSHLAPLGDTIRYIAQLFTSGDWSRIPTMIESLGNQFAAYLRIWGEQFVEWIQPAVDNILAELPGMAQSIFDWVIEQVPILARQLGQWGMEFIRWIGPMLPELARTLGNIASEIFSFIIRNAPILLRKLIDEWVPAFVAWVFTAIREIGPYLDQFLREIVDWITNRALPQLGEASMSMGSIIGEKARDGLYLWQPAIMRFFDWLGGLIESMRQNIGNMNIGQHGEIPTEGLGRRAIGGPVAAMQPYLVGERGPELFVPRTAGNIISNQNLRNDDNRRVTVNIYANNADDVTDRFAADPRVRDYLKLRPRW